MELTIGLSGMPSLYTFSFSLVHLKEFCWSYLSFLADLGDFDFSFCFF